MWRVAVVLSLLACTHARPAPAPHPATAGLPPPEGVTLVATEGDRASCGIAQACQFACPYGSCDIDCAPGSTCQATCDGGSCAMSCGAGATCAFTCDGGSCEQTCGAGTCAMTCDGGSCEVIGAAAVPEDEDAGGDADDGGGEDRD